jgi:hypothetical protein
MEKKLFTAITAFLLSYSISASAINRTNCRVLTGGVRVDSRAILASLQDVCEVKGSIGIFLDGVTEASFPMLEKAELINIESYGLEAINFPMLKQVRWLYISGAQLKVAEFPKLRSVGNTFSIKSRRLQYLNFPELGTVWKFNIQGNAALEYIFLDSLYDVYNLHVENNPLLNDATMAVLKISTRVLTEEEKDYLKHAEEEIRHVKRKLLDRALDQPPMRPTGLPAGYGDYSRYISWYPYHYYNYWQNISHWNYQRFYYLPFR